MPLFILNFTRQHRLVFSLQLLLTIMFGLSLSQLAWGLPEDREAQIKVKSQSMSWNNQQQLATYIGQVEMQQGELFLQADRVRIQRTAAGDLKQALANNQQGLAYMRDLPDLDKPEVEAWGEILDYRVLENLIIITGQAKLVQGEDVFTGHKLVYNLLTEDIQASQKPNSNQPVEVILKPAKNSDKKTDKKSDQNSDTK